MLWTSDEEGDGPVEHEIAQGDEVKPRSPSATLLRLHRKVGEHFEDSEEFGEKKREILAEDAGLTGTRRRNDVLLTRLPDPRQGGGRRVRCEDQGKATEHVLAVR